MRDEDLAALPMMVRAPCAGCRYLKPTRYEEYVRCGYYDENPRPVMPALYAGAMPPDSLSVGATTKKHVDGPHAADAHAQTCSLRVEA